MPFFLVSPISFITTSSREGTPRKTRNWKRTLWPRAARRSADRGEPKEEKKEEEEEIRPSIAAKEEEEEEEEARPP